LLAAHFFLSKLPQRSLTLGAAYQLVRLPCGAKCHPLRARNLTPENWLPTMTFRFFLSLSALIKLSK
jgi:hypothetical protein